MYEEGKQGSLALGPMYGERAVAGWEGSTWGMGASVSVQVHAPLSLGTDISPSQVPAPLDFSAYPLVNTGQEDEKGTGGIGDSLLSCSHTGARSRHCPQLSARVTLARSTWPWPTSSHSCSSNMFLTFHALDTSHPTSPSAGISHPLPVPCWPRRSTEEPS